MPSVNLYLKLSQKCQSFTKLCVGIGDCLLGNRMDLNGGNPELELRRQSWCSLCHQAPLKKKIRLFKFFLKGESRSSNFQVEREYKLDGAFLREKVKKTYSDGQTKEAYKYFYRTQYFEIY